MPNLRRSLQSKNSGGLSPTRIHATAAIGAPRKVIKALYDYNTRQPEEMSFHKGDFFHVVGNEDDEDWYEACNPITGARGYVPVTYFQTLEKSGQQMYQQQTLQQRQRNSNQSFEDNGNDSGAFMESSPHQYHSPPLHQPQHHQQHIQHSHSYSNGGSGVASAAAAVADGISSTSSPSMSQKSVSSPSLPKCQPLYGIVLYDFGAERADELDSKAGDAILVIAQSNEEWYVAKPIGRLGGPGLIPVSFVEIRDMVSGKPINVPEMLRQTGTVIPRVDEWKKQTMEYKANSIPLGRIDANDAPQQPQPQPQPQLAQHAQHLAHQQYHPQAAQGLQMHSQPLPLQHQYPQNGGPTIQQLKNKLSRGDLRSPNQRDQSSRRNLSQDLDIGRRVEGSNGRAAHTVPVRSFSNDNYEDSKQHNSGSRIVHATVESFHHEDDQYWFSVRVDLASGASRNLFRVYDDFYNFHIAILEEFPVESGRVGDQPRILPFMPIPLQIVNDTVSASRRADLDGYVQDLCKLPARIMQHPLVENLFAVKDGDTETPPGANGSTGVRPISPGLGRSNQHREPEHRGSPVAGPRAVFASRGAQQGPRSYIDDSPSPSTSAGVSPGLRSPTQFPPTPNIGSSSSEEMIKVKISFKDDIMAMRIPVTITFKALQQKIFDRLQAENKSLSYRDDRGDLAIIQGDADVLKAIDRSGGKLMIYVD
ncbi:hypothetical protein BC939DRAFT_467271 [Gamsiella multidivaricata]|uniref:uncharacterized protein n=1 Tax=Gamsiella multidivaricata TaxID=101098 RepID=UPI00221EAEFB|nr:uncharacterized protein BC939DRAFT_467271 [Gamsiella multidivaricata]KAG0362615.1 bud emergence protein 1 [Gamsiella multidivaricata]KAI7816995.1 hypothetical protein BC939DRAFT_467271 [Gamsiella multidivaricata]